MIIISAILAIALAFVLLCYAQVWQQNQRLMRLADEQADLIQEQMKLIDDIWQDYQRKLQKMKEWEDAFRDADRIRRWADFGEPLEQVWWE